MASIPYAAYEDERTFHDMDKRRWFIICIILIVALIASNVAWLLYEKQFETVTETEVVEEYQYEVEQDAETGDNNFIGHDGDIRNGKAEN